MAVPAVLHHDATVLIVDDDAPYRMLLEALVADLVPDVRIVAAEDAWNARWERSRIRSPLLVISDHRMPGETGLDMLSAFHLDRRPGEHLVLLTSYVDDAGAQAALAAGIDDVLHKPAGIDDLELLLQRCIDAWAARVEAARIHV